MQLLGNLGSFYVMLSECDGTMGIVPSHSLTMTENVAKLPKSCMPWLDL
jgi:hypothetical protein